MVILFAAFGYITGYIINRVYAPALATSSVTTTQQYDWHLLHRAVEVSTAGFFAYAWFNNIFLIIPFVLFMLITVVDIKYRLILNVVIYPAIAATLIYHIFFSSQDFRYVVTGAALAFGIFYLTAWLKPGQLGGGDIKLATLIGCLFGFPGVLWALLIGAGVGAIFAIGLLLTTEHTLKSTIPYGPFLCMGAMTIVLVNPAIV